MSLSYTLHAPFHPQFPFPHSHSFTGLVCVFMWRRQPNTPTICYRRGISFSCVCRAVHRSAHELHEQALKLAEHTHGVGKEDALFIHPAVGVHVLVRARGVDDRDHKQSPAARRLYAVRTSSIASASLKYPDGRPSESTTRILRRSVLLGRDRARRRGWNSRPYCRFRRRSAPWHRCSGCRSLSGQNP